MSFAFPTSSPIGIDEILPLTFSQPNSYILVISLIAASFLLIPTQGKDGIPCLGPANTWGLLCGSVKSIFRFNARMEEGYRKFNGRPFRFPELLRWRVLVSDRAQIEEICKAPDKVLSFYEASKEIVALEYVFGAEITHSNFSAGAIRAHLTRDYSLLIPNMLDELVYAMDKIIPNSGDSWTTLPALETSKRIIGWLTNRVIVGLPVCRNEEFLRLAHSYTEDVIRVNTVNKFLPGPLKSFYVKHISLLPSTIERAIEILRDTIEYRVQQHETNGKSWPGKPVDMLAWLIDKAEGEFKSVKVLTQSIMAINFAATHTTATGLTHALYQLAVMPECVETLREEITNVVQSEGFSKQSLSSMRLLDSFVKESIRFHGIVSMSAIRLALEDYSLSDGTFFPAGTHIAASTFSIHHDKDIYERPDEFIPFRFATEEGRNDIRLSASTTSVEYLPFGYGKQSCPGRYLAIAEIKAIMAHIILNYDFKLNNDGQQMPKSTLLWAAIVPNAGAKLAFRKRPESERPRY